MPLTINGGNIRKEGGNSPYGGYRSPVSTETAQVISETAASKKPAETKNVLTDQSTTIEATPDGPNQQPNPEDAQTVTNQAEGQLFPNTPIQSQ